MRETPHPLCFSVVGQFPVSAAGSDLRLKGGAVTYTKCDISLHIKRKYLHVLGPRHSDKTAYLLQTQPLWILLILED